MSVGDWLKVKLVTKVFQPLLDRRRLPPRWRSLRGFKQVNLNAALTRCTLEFENGFLFIEAPAPRILKIVTRFSSEKTSPVFDGDYFTYAVLERNPLPLCLSLENDSCRVTPEGSEENPLSVRVNLNRGTVDVLDGARLLHSEKHAAASAGNWVRTVTRMPGNSLFLGLGQKTGGLFKNGKRYVMWNTDNSDIKKDSDPLYQSCPFAIVLDDQGTAHGLFFDSPHYAVFRMSKKAPQALDYAAARGPLTRYVLGGPALPEVCARFSLLTGTYNLPPLWALGHHHSRWEPAESAARLGAIAEEFRKRGVPCDALHIDIVYMRGFRCFTWDADRFPDPDGFLEGLREAHFHPVIITDPALKKDNDWEIFREGRDKNYFLTDPAGKLPNAPVWPGDSGFPDFANPRVADWWGKLFSIHTNKRIDGYWIDMNEPSVFTPRRTLPDNLIHRTEEPETNNAGNTGKPRDHASLHNYYGFLMAKATAAGLTKLLPGRRFFLFTRSSYAGIQRYASSWTGDNRSDWDHVRLSIPMILNMGLCGQVMTGPDIGGFWGTPTPELFLRFLAAATFFPFHRNHTASGTPPQEIWHFGEENEAIAKGFITLRYAYLPYLYTALRQSTVTGVPLVRPLVYDSPLDPDCRKPEFADTEYLCGDDLLVAPVLHKGKTTRAVHFPDGRHTYHEEDDANPGPATEWVYTRTHQIYPGGTTEVVAAPLDVLPLFVRRGSVISKAGNIQAIDLLYDEPLTLAVYPDPDFRGELYLDDGKTFSYRDGIFSLVSVSGRSDKEKTTVTIKQTDGRLAPSLYRWEKVVITIARLSGEENASAITVNGKPVPGHAIKTTDHWIIVKLSTGELF